MTSSPHQVPFNVAVARELTTFENEPTLEQALKWRLNEACDEIERLEEQLESLEWKRDIRETHLREENQTLDRQCDEWERRYEILVLAVKENSEVNPLTYRLAHLIGDRPDWAGAVSNPASSPNVTSLPVCPECAEGRHVYCLDDGSSTWTGKCRCTCGDESRPASRQDV